MALKLLLPHAALDVRWRRRFLNEGALTRVDHPHVIRVFEAGRAEGMDYLVMEYCAGPSLARWMGSADGPVPVRLAARIVAEVAEGAAFCHEQGIIHRDISPSNVLLFPREPSPADEFAFGYSVKLADFGLAKGLPRAGARDEADTLTSPGAIMGKPEYLAPRSSARDARPATPGSTSLRSASSCITWSPAGRRSGGSTRRRPCATWSPTSPRPAEAPPPGGPRY